VYIFETQEELNKLREKIDIDMKVKEMKNVNPEKDSALYTNLDGYTSYYYELPEQYLSKNTKGCIISETEIKLGDSNFNHFIAEIKKIALTSLKSKNN
jgi:hypothetical protein